MIVLAFTAYSCSDIMTSDPNIISEVDSSTVGWKELMGFRFQSETKIYRNNDTSVVMQAEVPEMWGKYVHIVNLTKDSMFVITDVSLLKGDKFLLDLPKSFPLYIQPYKTENKNAINLKLPTTKVSLGLVEDKIIINKDTNAGIYIRVFVVQ